MPVIDVTWGDAARFCNWLQNGQPTGAEGNGTTETGSYALTAQPNCGLMAVTRNAEANYWLFPSETEWYKAAFYNGGGPTPAIGLSDAEQHPAHQRLSASGTNNANYYNGGHTDAAEFPDPRWGTYYVSRPYGTFDMGGDVFQFNESPVFGGESDRVCAVSRTTMLFHSSATWRRRPATAFTRT